MSSKKSRSKLPAGPFAGLDQAVRRICAMRDWSISEAARRIGVDRSAMGRRMDGSYDWPIREIDELVAAAGLTLRDFTDLLDEINGREMPQATSAAREDAVAEVVDELTAALGRVRARLRADAASPPR